MNCHCVSPLDFRQDRDTFARFSKFLMSFCVALVTLNPLSGHILYHSCIPLIVPRFSFFMRILWSAVMIPGMSVCELRLQAALVIFARLQISHFGSLGKCVNRLCFPYSLSEGRGSGRGDYGGSLLSLAEEVHLGSTKPSVNSSNHSGKSCNRLLDARVVP